MNINKLTLEDCIRLQKRNINVIVKAGEVVGFCRTKKSEDKKEDIKKND